MAPVPDPMPGLGIIIADMAHTEYNDDFLHKFVLKPIKLTGAEPTRVGCALQYYAQCHIPCAWLGFAWLTEYRLLTKYMA
jgi:hypothetical protein